MRLFLISTIPGGYAEREFRGIQYCLNKSNEDFCLILNNDTYDEDILTVKSTDFFIVADYYFNPTFKVNNVNDAILKLISRLPAEQTAIYYSDPLFKFEDPSKFENWKYFVFFGMSNYRQTETEEYKDCRIWENVDIKTKQILNLPIAEMAFWSYIQMHDDIRFFPKTKLENDFSYIINSKIKARLQLLDFLDGFKCQFGNFPAIDNKEIQEFVKHNPECEWVTQKAFGIDYLYLQNGKFTLVLDDDKPIRPAWPMRFYECMAVGIIPLIDVRKDPKKEVYLGRSQLTKCYFSNKEDLKELVEYFSDPIKHFELYLDSYFFMKDYVYDYKSLYDKTIRSLIKKI